MSDTNIQDLSNNNNSNLNIFNDSSLGLLFKYDNNIFNVNIEKGEPLDGYLYIIFITSIYGRIEIKISLTQSNIQLDQQASPIFDHDTNRIQIQEGTPTRRDKSIIKYITEDNIPCLTTQIYSGDSIYKAFLISVNQMYYHCMLYPNINQTRTLLDIWENTMLPSFQFYSPDITANSIPSVVWSFYNGNYHPYHMKYPCDWIINEKQNNSLSPLSSNLQVEFKFGSDDIDISVLIIEDTFTEDIEFRDYYTMCKVQFQKTGIPLTTVTAKDITLSEIKGKQFNYSPIPGTDIFTRFIVIDKKAIIITCESKNNHTLKVGPVLESMMDSFCFKNENHDNTELLYYFEHFEEKIGLEFPKFLEYSQEDILFKVFDPDNPLTTFDIQSCKENKDTSINLKVTQDNIIKSYGIEMNIVLESSKEIIISNIELPGIEFITSGYFVPDILCTRVTRLIKRYDTLYCLSFTSKKDSFIKWGLTLLESIKFL